MNSSEVRSELVRALQLDLVGPGHDVGNPAEVLPQAPSRWYLTGFLVPIEADAEQRVDADSTDEVDEAGDGAGIDDNTTPEPASARQRYLPSSMGLSVLVGKDSRTLDVTVRWADYKRRVLQPPASPQEGSEAKPASGHRQEEWVREQRETTLKVDLPLASSGEPKEFNVSGSGGLAIVLSIRSVNVTSALEQFPAGTRSVSVFLVNRRKPSPDITRDEAFAFQANLEVVSDVAFVARPNFAGLNTSDWDEKVADLQYRDACEYAVGHSVATEAVLCDCDCKRVRTVWIPQAEVERVAPSKMEGVTLEMERLADLENGADAVAHLGKLVTLYKSWIKQQADAVTKPPGMTAQRRETAEELLNKADVAARRIEAGIALLADSQCLEAFRIANRVMAKAAKRRQGVMQGKTESEVIPEWRPFQLAFILMNLKGIADPNEHDRDVVDLLFFPTGGGKTEAYLGLSAFTLVLRRLRNPGIASAGVSVLMRYTLRLLTLDQLGRASTLICALELERQADAEKLGEWPFEIGLWVGKAATPNDMGRKGDNRQDTARAKVKHFKDDDRKPSPVPLEECPWCGTKFKPNSFHLHPNFDDPAELHIRCVNRDCQFSRGNSLPIQAVDEPIYRRLPCFIIATVDKFAAMPWTGQVGSFFGRVQRYDKHGFYGPCDGSVGNPLPGERLQPPELVIQDELHLISGPLGTMVGLYETALDELSVIERNGKRVRPKIIASTATVRRAESQIRALFNRRFVDIFPPPGPNRRDSFFAETEPSTTTPARQYLGIAAQGRSPKVVMLRVYLALMAAAEYWSRQHPKKSTEANPADPYMTLLGYFNALRELGGARRLIEDEVRNRLSGYAARVRVGENQDMFQNREIDYEPVELTSRVSTAKVAEAKRRLSLPFTEKKKVDVAIATNMISVGLDIIRLGLMVVFGQPKTSAEYIQATSRVGRDVTKPGLVVTILNIHKPRDRSHYERFCAYHESFYRSVEATSVTPFSPRALDRGLAGTLVALARHGLRPMTAPRGAIEILRERTRLEFVVRTLADRAFEHADSGLPSAEKEALKERVRREAESLLDVWSKLATELDKTGTGLQYQTEVGSAQRLLFEFLNADLKGLPVTHPRMRFRANRSLRDVEPSVNLWVKHADGVELVEDDQ